MAAAPPHAGRALQAAAHTRLQPCQLVSLKNNNSRAYEQGGDRQAKKLSLSVDVCVKRGDLNFS